RALSDLNLLGMVVDFKKKFYRSNRARYDLAAAGTLKLLPPEQNESALAKDYEKMKSMFFGDAPEFSEILRGLKELEDEINSIQLNG
ncbi:MAG: nucleotidyl transferase AbiEii/AbiGii toxin family protein, partial [Methanocorpusculum sp.]|nr:nucleotidyl transferase AbiEii/AbiGii toxin family protein [Methanocorpusculum sp.]